MTALNIVPFLALAALCAFDSLAEAQHAIVSPKRLALEQKPTPLPSLPVDAKLIESATMDVVLDGQAGQVLRTAQRILVLTENREWMFERNSLDPRRVSATIVEHAAKAIIHYEESDLRNLLGINGWAGVLNYTGASNRALTVERTRDGIDTRLLLPPVVRFPEYTVFEVADWLESRGPARIR